MQYTLIFITQVYTRWTSRFVDYRNEMWPPVPPCNLFPASFFDLAKCLINHLHQASIHLLSQFPMPFNSLIFKIIFISNDVASTALWHGEFQSLTTSGEEICKHLLFLMTVSYSCNNVPLFTISQFRGRELSISCKPFITLSRE